MKEEYIIAYDLGSTGLKTAMFNTSGKTVASKYLQINTYYLKSTWIEQDPDEWWKTVCVSTRELLEEVDIDANQVRAIAPVGHQIGAVPVDKNGALVREKTLYAFDARSSKQSKELIKRIGDYPSFYRIHGLGHPPEILSICKIMWLKENEPDIYEKAYKFLQAKDYITLCLTDKRVFVDDFGDASNTGWLDIKRRKYSDELIEAAGLSRDKLPELRESHEIAGYVAGEAARQTGLMEGTPIVTGTGDVPAACIGAGIVREKMCYCSIGSANWNGVFVNEPSLDPDIRMINVCHPWKNYCTFSYTAAGVISQDWFEDSICDVDKEIAEKIGIPSYEISKIRAMRTPAGSKGLIYLPYLRGGGGPHWNPNATGAFIGIHSLHKKDHFVRAIYEGVALNFRWLMEQTEKAGVSIIEDDGIRAIGGGAKNSVWLQIYSDVLGMKFSVLESQHEATSRGGFIAASVGLNWYRDYMEAADKIVNIDKDIVPDMQNNKIYNKLYPIFKSSYEALTSVFDQVSLVREEIM